MSRIPASYRETFEILGENGILPEPLTRDLSALAGFRNVPVHICGIRISNRSMRFRGRIPVFSKHASMPYRRISVSGVLPTRKLPLFLSSHDRDAPAGGKRC
jgi:hypothetical protein